MDNTNKKKINDYFGNIPLVENSGFVSFDHSWHTPENISLFIDLISKGIEESIKDEIYDTILIVDTIKPTFGLLPFSGFLSQKLNKKLLIWKEYGNYLTGTPKIYGHIYPTDFTDATLNTYEEVEQFCASINSAEYKIPRVSKISEVNEILKIPSFFKQISETIREEKHFLSEDIDKLLNNVKAVCMKEYNELTGQERFCVKRLNRLLLERVHLETTDFLKRKVTIIQDVLLGGMTISKIINTLKESEYSKTIDVVSIFIAVNLMSTNEKEGFESFINKLSKAKQKITFHYLFASE